MSQILPQQHGTAFFTDRSAFLGPSISFELLTSKHHPRAINGGQRPWSSNLLTWDSVIEFWAS